MERQHVVADLTMRPRTWLFRPRGWRLVLVLLGCGCIGVAGLVGHEDGDTAAREYQQGRDLFDAGRYADAANHFAAALAASPSSIYAQWLGRAYGLEAQDANLLSKPGLASRSREALERAVAMNPENVGARSDLAAYYQAAPGFLGGGLDRAQAQVAEIRKLDPYLGQVRAGDLLWDGGDATAALAAYHQAVKLDADRTEAHERLGSSALEHRQYKEAFSQWDELLTHDRTQPDGLYGLGKTAVLSGQRTAEGEAALRTFLATAKPDPDGPTPARAHFYLGRLLALKADSQARAEFETALRLEPKLREARQALEASGK